MNRGHMTHYAIIHKSAGRKTKTSDYRDESEDWVLSEEITISHEARARYKIFTESKGTTQNAKLNPNELVIMRKSLRDAPKITRPENISILIKDERLHTHTGIRGVLNASVMMGERLSQSG